MFLFLNNFTLGKGMNKGNALASPSSYLPLEMLKEHCPCRAISAKPNQNIILDKKTEDLFRRLIFRLINSYHTYAGVTLGPPRTLRLIEQGDTSVVDKSESLYKRVTPQTVALFKQLFISNSKIPNIATLGLDMENYLDYAMMVQEYLPQNGVIVFSNDKNMFRKIYDPHFFMNCNLEQDDLGYRFIYDTSIRVMNGYNKSYKEVKFTIGRIIKLRIYILIDPFTKEAKIYKIKSLNTDTNTKQQIQN